MQVPLELAFHKLDHSDALEQTIRERADKLHRYFKKITSCRVRVEAENKSQYNTQNYRCHVELTVPGDDLVVSNDPGGGEEGHQDVYVAIRDAFDTAERRLKTYAEKLREDRKAEHRTGPPTGVVAKLFPTEGYGFIEGDDGRQIYFHQNSLINLEFTDLDVGTRVRFHEEQGNEGPQASSVKSAE